MQSEYTGPSVTPMRPTAAKRQLIEEVGNVCFRCMASPDEDARVGLAIDHIVPVARGGLSVYENYQLLCSPCNSWKGTRIIDFRPGKSRQEIATDLPLLPVEQRTRAVPIARAKGPFLPQHPPSHDCSEAVQPFITAMSAMADDRNELAHQLVASEARADKAEEELTHLRIDHRRAERLAEQMKVVADAQEARAADLQAERDAAEARAAQLAEDLERTQRPWWRKLWDT